jgi:glutamate dehydrogenase
MPFLVDSVTMEVNRHGLTLHLITHPLLPVVRDASGALIGFAPERRDAPRESFIHVEVDRTTDPAQLEALAADIARVLGDVRMAFDDWKKMQEKMLAIVADLDAHPPPLPADELEEGKAFLTWLASDHFTLLGYRCHDLVTVDGAEALRIVPGSSLGILRESGSRDGPASLTVLPPEQRAFARFPELLIITKSNSRSTVHRPVISTTSASSASMQKGK